MKRLMIFALITLICTAGFLIFHKKWVESKRRAGLNAGKTARNFILGMKDSVVYHLNDFFGEYIIVLVFLDDNYPSSRFDGLFRKNIENFVLKRKNIIWFNIKRQRMHAIIEEKTNKLKLKYRTLYSNLPEFYNFSHFPSVLIIDKHGIIRLVYIGYSPTIVNDLKNSILEISG